MKRIFIIDDNKDQLILLKGAVEKRGYKVYTFLSAKEGFSKIDTYMPFLVITDMKMPNMTGKELLYKIKTNYPDIEVVIITGYGEIEEAVECMKMGAYHYMLKPINMDELFSVIDKIWESVKYKSKASVLEETIENIYGDFVYKDPAMENVLQMVKRVAPTDTPVLITGETGSGKEVVARLIHNLSGRKGAFVPVNMASIPESLLESELFGYRKGAFTGADKSKPGKFELAEGGTIFLDEIGEMNIDLQSKILRVLDYGYIDPIGGVEPVKTDARVISATNRDIEEMMKKGKFREDLFYRLNTIRIHIPPLRERKGDIIPLTEYFIKKIADKIGIKNIIIPDESKEKLLSYNWPGNVRELKNVVERSLILNGGPYFIPVIDTVAVSTNCDKTLKEVEKEHIIRVLNFTDWNRKKAAEILGIHRNTLMLKIKEYQIKRENG